MFNINLFDWKGCKILDCPAGASSFVAESSKYDIYAVGCDPLFGNDIKVLVSIGKADIEHVMERVSHVPHLYKWDFYPSIDVLKEYRMLALKRFAEDYSVGAAEGRYIKAALPRLPFKDNSFDLVLSGHFLFTYSDKFDYSFHLDSILELFRVCSKELRIYPIQGPDARPYKYINELLYDLERENVTARLLSVPFEFQQGSNQMLQVSK
ncbi:MAG: class I SAM-dependent methyltransferase [Euryarchaeota archaeon]|nr:class I SAM-dependent methyltransferase [Euryarchaeota archaeon]